MRTPVSWSILALFVASSASAAPIRFDFTGSSGIDATVVGYFAYESDTPDENPHDSGGRFPTGELFASVTGGRHDGMSFLYTAAGAPATGSLFVQTQNNVVSAESDGRFDALSFNQSTSAAGSMFMSRLLLMTATEAELTALTSDDLPVTLDLAQFGLYRKLWLGDDPTRAYTLDSLTRVPIPEPASLLLMLTGAGASLWSRRRRG